MPNEPPSPSASSILLPFLGARSRRGSLASITSRRELDRDALAEALDSIHGAASKTETLTSFHDFDGGMGRSNSGAKDLVSSSMSGLYHKFKSSVGQSSTANGDSARPSSRSGADSLRSSLQSHPRMATPTGQPAGRLAQYEDSHRRSQLGNQVLTDAVLGQNGGLPTTNSAANDKLTSRVSNDTSAASVFDKSSNRSPAAPSVGKTSQSRSGRSSLSTLPDGQHPLKSDAPVRALRYEHINPSMAAPQLSNQSASATRMDARPSLHRAQDGTATAVQMSKTHSKPQTEDLQRPAMVHVGVSHLPGFQPSEASTPAVDGGPTPPLSRTLSDVQSLQPSPNLNSGLQRRRTGPKQEVAASHTTALPSHLKRRVISKEFWMKDENAKVCFDCGQSFSTFRRKHHCRTCGQIFDAKCTSLVSGTPFGQPGTLRLCKPCEDIIFGSNEDDSSFYSDDAEDAARRQSMILTEDLTPPNRRNSTVLESGSAGTPTIGIPASRRNREAKRRSAVIEFDAQPTLMRPTSSRSLVSLTGRPRSASHKRHPSRAQLFRSSKSSQDQGPFSQDGEADAENRSLLPAFHNDNIIDPDLAAYLSEDESDEDEQLNILAAFDGESDTSAVDREKSAYSMFSPANRRLRAKPGDRSLRDDDAQSIISKAPSRLAKRGTPSISSLNAFKPSPRRSRSNRYLNRSSVEERFIESAASSPNIAPSCSKIERSANIHGCTARSFELNQASYEHVRKMLVQMLKDAAIDHPAAWEKALMPMLLRCTNDVNPDVPRGDDMDIRHYVKLKKIPGGRPSDTSYVSGVMFSKQIALKSMARSISNPRIAVVTFPIEYARHQSHFMSLEPVIAQEQEYLSNLVHRITALRPHLLLVQRNVSGLALRLLDEAGVTVAFNIKESVLAAVARVTRTTMIKSIDKLTIDPHHLGRCDGFDVKTYIHDGARKTYIVLSGCQPDLGCTIILRGADIPILRTLKRITEFMCYVVYNLRLETYLLRDEFASIPSDLIDQLAASSVIESKRGGQESVPVDSGNAGDSEYAAMEKRVQSRVLSASPFIVFMQPHLLTQLRATEQKLREFGLLKQLYANTDDEDSHDEKSEDYDNFELVQPAMVRATPSMELPKAVREYLHAVHSAQYDRTNISFEHQRKLWQAFLANNTDPFDPLSHQTIVVLHSTVSSITSAPCVGPELLGLGFYAGFNRVDTDLEEDCTLGQYVEDACLGAGNTCKECSRKMIDHYRQYVHGQGQLSISVQRQSSRISGMNNIILMWSICKLCQAETSVLPMSDNTWKYSFAKYLELSFWSRPLRPRAKVCDHDLHKDFVRCFGFQDLVVKLQYDPIEIYDVVVPRTTIAWSVESDLTVKNEQYQLFETRLNAFIDSIKKRLNTINVDTLDEKQMLEAQETLESLRTRADQDRHELLQKLRAKYASARYYELIPLNRALRFMDEKALAWDEVFNNFEKDYFPSETDIRKLAAAQLKEMFYGSQSSTESMISELGDEEGGAELTTFTPKPQSQQLTDDGFLNEKTDDVLATVAQEYRSSGVGDEIAQTNVPSANNPSTVTTEHVLTSNTNPLAKSNETVVRPSAEEPSSNLNGEVTSNDSSEQDLANGASSRATSSTRTRPGPGLVQRIEQIRGLKDSEKDATIVSDTKIPRLQNVRRTTEEPVAGPDILSSLRTQSQPSVPSRSATSVSNTPTDRTSKPSADSESGQLERRLQDRIGRLTSKLGAFPPSLIPRSVPSKSDQGSTTTTVSALAKHFEHLSREFEKERLRERRLRAAKSRQARANPLASSRPVVKVYKNATEAVGEQKLEGKKDKAAQQVPNGSISTDPSVSGPSTQTGSKEDSVKVESQLTGRTSVESPVEAGMSDDELPSTTRLSQDTAPLSSQTDVTPSSLSIVGENDLELQSELAIPDHKRNVWLKALAEFWSKRSASGWSSLEYPLHNTEHVFEDSDIIVREDEPSSVIALSLASSDYLNKVKDFRSSVPGTRKNAQSNDTDVADHEIQQAIEASLLKDTGTHMKYSFSHGQVKASCKIFYAEAFDALRRRCGVANRFVESMSRCMKFDSKGGKTKSLFLKTLDNRFIIKSLQEVEIKAFTRFAPDYFAFMSHTLFRGLPSVIAKMFGLFQVIVKNPATGMDFSYYLLVMENLFYDHTPDRRFDLKGSMRNRKIESTGQPDEVLLDENLVETIFESPLFVREHSRRLLQASVWNDTLWLCKQNVMDYSLMAGFEDNARQLVVGIIDCIRTYTWDKKLESWIKDRGKNKPTITSPKDYRNRFRVSMMQYVLQAPTCWHEFQASMAPLKTLKEKDDAAVPE